ncbi:MAG: fructose-bisphosphate aldolase [Deltaproteobacteria bacterium]|nr:fructose-bisphosphate aldolase [Deltaproteobacteria bacterium]
MSKTKLRFFERTHFTNGELQNISKFVRESGRTLILPYDQFVEHDCRHLDAESDAGNPNYILQLGLEGGYNAVAIHYGLAKRYWTKYKNKIPLILKVNGKTSIPEASKPLSVYTSFVEDAAKLGAVGVGYTMYYGSPRQDEDLPQLSKVRQECEKYNLPLIVWAYPRGEAVDAKGGRDSSYMVESAVRMATEMGATIIKANVPQSAPQNYQDIADVPSYYKKLELQLQNIDAVSAVKERIKRVVTASQGIPVLFSGGSKVSDEDLLNNAQYCIQGGCFGFIFGRNMWKRPHKSALEITKKLISLLDSPVKEFLPRE